MVASAEPLMPNERAEVERAIQVLSEKGFEQEVFLLEHLTAFRRTDNWLNASIDKENAYAATNFPFEIITIYPEFSILPMDDVERAAILLHESKHLEGKGEPEAYEFLWRHRDQLGWTAEKYGESVLWLNIRRQTREYAPQLFTCTSRPFGDCTENALLARDLKE